MENKNKIIGTLLIAGAVALLIPYTVLTLIFEYPDILRQDTATILIKFHQGGATLIWTWFSFALTGIPLIAAFVMLGQWLEKKSSLARLTITIGVVALVVQMIGLLRWTFVVPVLADTFVNASEPATKASVIVVFKAIHQFGGVLLGEHMGQLFTIVWTILVSVIFYRIKLFPKWIIWLGCAASLIYLLAQAELFATVIPNFPHWDLAGFVGSTLWVLWLIIVGVKFRLLHKE